MAPLEQVHRHVEAPGVAAFIGFAGIAHTPFEAAFTPAIEAGWRLARAHWGQGYATEAAAELIRVAFEELDLHRVVATCFAANEPSWRLMERLGMRREEHAVADALHRSGAWLDTYGYARTAGE